MANFIERHSERETFKHLLIELLSLLTWKKSARIERIKEKFREQAHKL